MITRRVVIFCLVGIWAGVEFFGGSQGWAIFFAALTAYVGWGFFMSGQPDEPLDPGTGTGSEAEKAPTPKDQE